MAKKKNYSAGRLGTEHRKFMMENIDVLGYEGIAEHFNKNINTIIAFCRQNGIVPNIKKDEYMRREAVKASLTLEKFWKETREQLTPEEREFFTDQYAEYMLQFEKTAPVSHSEKMQLRSLIVNEIVLNRCMRRQIQFKKEADQISLEIMRATAAGDKSLENRLREQFDLKNSAFASFAKEAKEVQDRISVLNKELKATRQQLVDKLHAATSNFGGILKMLEDEQMREREGKQINIFRAAVEKERARLLAWHKYADDNLDVPLMTPETQELYDETNSNHRH